uniref:Uncharacterized protein n=1 Tax=Fagus sylvatica TaxID=28930 RepID=A0A2N9FEN5_FAGSY
MELRVPPQCVFNNPFFFAGFAALSLSSASSFCESSAACFVEREEEEEKANDTGHVQVKENQNEVLFVGLTSPGLGQ